MVLETALQRGYSVHVFDLPTARNRGKAAYYSDRLSGLMWGDLRNFDDVRNAITGMDVVIHLGAVIAPISERNPELSYAVNVGGTRNIVRSIEEYSPETALVYASSMSIMGADADRKPPLRADDPVSSSSHYTSHKIACEQLIRESHVRWVISRLGAVINTDLEIGGGSPKDLMTEIFSMKLDNRIEVVWNIDAATAFVNVAGMLCSGESEVEKKIFFIGGGGGNGWQMTARDLYASGFDAIGIGMVHERCFSNQPYYADWLDTGESQRLLRYQNHRFDEFITALKRKMRYKRFFIWVVSPLIRSWMERFSPSGRRTV